MPALRPALLACLLALPSLAFGQTSVERMLTPDELRGGPPGALAPGGATPAPGVQAAPATATPVPGSQAAAATLDQERSWAWLLAHPGSVSDAARGGRTLLAVDAPSRAVFVIEWTRDGRLAFLGASHDPQSAAVQDLATRMRTPAAPGAGQGDAPFSWTDRGINDPGLYWGSWNVVRMGQDADAGWKQWDTSASALRIAVTGERSRAQRVPLPGAKALLVIFPMQPGSASDWDVQAGAPDHPGLLGPLNHITSSEAAAPFAPLAGVPDSWAAGNGQTPGGFGRYKDALGRGWIFTVLTI